MPISEKKKVYLFSNRHERRFKSVLLSRSLAICFWSDKKSKLTIIEKTKIIKTKKTKRMRIIICKSLLPRHCDGKLVEQALDFLQIYPEDNELLKNLGDYIKNDSFEFLGYWGVAIGTIGSCCSLGIFYTIVVIYPLVFHPYVGVISICLIATSATFFIVNVFYDNALGLKFGRWVGKLIEGTHRKPINLKELTEKLMTRIHGDKKETCIPAYEDSRIASAEDTQQKTINLEELERKLMTRIRSDEIGEAIKEAFEELINEGSCLEFTGDTQQKTINLEELKRILMTRIQRDEVEKAIEAIEETIEELLNKDRRVESTENNRLARQSLDHFWSTGTVMQATEMKTFREYQRYV